MCVTSATPDLRLSSQPQGINHRPLAGTKLYCWWQRHMCVNNFPTVAFDTGEARILFTYSHVLIHANHNRTRKALLKAKGQTNSKHGNSVMWSGLQSGTQSHRCPWHCSLGDRRTSHLYRSHRCPWHCSLGDRRTSHLYRSRTNKSHSFFFGKPSVDLAYPGVISGTK